MTLPTAAAAVQPRSAHTVLCLQRPREARKKSEIADMSLFSRRQTPQCITARPFEGGKHETDQGRLAASRLRCTAKSGVHGLPRLGCGDLRHERAGHRGPEAFALSLAVALPSGAGGRWPGQAVSSPR